MNNYSITKQSYEKIAILLSNNGKMPINLIMEK